MRGIELTGVLAALTLAIGGASAAHAQDKGTPVPVSWKMAGASIHTQINHDNSGPPASATHSRVKGTFGIGSVFAMVEPIVIPVTRCPKNAKYEYKIRAATNVVTFDDNLDQIAYTLNNGYACQFEDGTITSEINYDVSGGTGRFKGATGKLTARVSPEALSYPEWKGEFNNSIYTTEGVVYLRDQH